MTGIKGNVVTMGLVHVEGLETQFAQKLIKQREIAGAYLHLQDFIERLLPGIEQLNILIRLGAFAFTGKNKKELLWEANFLQKKNVRHSVNSVLFKDKPVAFHLPVLEQHPLDDAIDEIELLGFSVSNPFALIDDDPNKYLSAKDIEQHLGKEVSVLGYLITSKPVHTVKHEMMYFHTFIDAKGDWLDTVFFPQIANTHNVTGKGFYAMKGKVMEEFGVYSLEVTFCRKIGIKSRAQKASHFLDDDKSHKQILVKRPL